MEIRSGTEGVPIPISEGNPYRTQRIPYPPHPSELINARPINREHSPDLLPRMSGPKPTYLEHSYYPGGANVNSPHGQPPTELLNPPNHIYEKPPMESETYRGNYPYNRGGFSGAPNGPRESYTSRDYSNYAKYPPPIQRDYVSHEREHTPNLNRLGPNGNDPVYRRTRENLPEGHPHWNPIESTLPPQRYPPSSMNYLENREFATAVTPERAPSFPRREEFLGAGQHRNLHFSEMDRGMEIKLEDVRNEQKVRNSSPLALDKVVENCRMLSHFAFEYGNRSEKVYPCPSDSLVREMAAKAQAILRVLTGLRSEGVKSGDRNEALDDDDMEYIRNKRTLLAPSRPKYRKRSKRSGQPPPGRCHSCNTTETPEWRRGPDGARTLCNACGLHFAKLTRKRAQVAAATVNDSNNSDNGETETSRRSDGEGRAENESNPSMDA